MKKDFWEFADCAGTHSRIEQIGGLEFQSGSRKDDTTVSVESLTHCPDRSCGSRESEKDRSVATLVKFYPNMLEGPHKHKRTTKKAPRKKCVYTYQTLGGRTS